MMRWLLVAIVLALNTGACGGAAKSAAGVNAVALLANDASGVMLGEYRREQEAAVASAVTREEALARTGAIRERWRPAWAAWEVLRAAHDEWAYALDDGTNTVKLATRVRAAYCAVRAALPGETRPKLPAAGCAP